MEITPAYYRDYLRRQFPQEYQSLLESFQTLDQTEHFPEMVQLLKQVRDYRGEGLPARLFYDGKVAEAVALVAERHLKRKNRRSVSAEDIVRLADVAAFITAHCADELPLERLSRIGCMSISKLKDAFHVRYGCTITQYIQGQRTEQAGRLLRETDLPVSQVAAIVNTRSSVPFRGDLPAKHRTLPCGISQSMLEFLHGGKRYGKERFFMKIQYFGDPSNPKIVVLHPMLLDGKSMLPLLGELRNSHCVIAPDLTGHGTDTGIFQSAQQEAATLAGWLTTQGWIDLKLVFGASIGAVVAMQLIAMPTFKVHTAVLEGCPLHSNAAFLRMMATRMFLSKHRKAQQHPGLSAQRMTKIYGETLGLIMGHTF